MNIMLDGFITDRAERIVMPKNLRGIVMFGIACIASPCCTPFVVPLLLMLLAGTPMAFWINQNLGWVYSGLTVVSIISFALAFQWSRKQPANHTALLRPIDIPIISAPIGENPHVSSIQ